MTQATKPLLLQPTTRHAVAATTLIIPIIPTGAATQRSTNQIMKSAARTVLHACTIAILRDCTRLSRRASKRTCRNPAPQAARAWLSTTSAEPSGRHRRARGG